MNTSTTHAIPVFCKTSAPSTKSFDNWFNGNKTNFGSKASQPSFDNKKILDNTINKHGMIMPM